ncbi:MAG: hypothetical protein AAF085_07140 [Planctomycetota bacterium]
MPPRGEVVVSEGLGELRVVVLEVFPVDPLLGHARRAAGLKDVVRSAGKRTGDHLLVRQEAQHSIRIEVPKGGDQFVERLDRRGINPMLFGVVDPVRRAGLFAEVPGNDLA